MDSIDLSTILVVVALLGCSAFFSAAETAFSSVNLLRIRSMAEEGNRNAKTAVRITSQFDKMLSTILIGNNVVNIGLSSLTTVIATNAFGSSGVAIATGVATFLVLTFGEIIPKSLAKENSEGIALSFAPLLSVLMLVLTPVAVVFMQLRRVFTRGVQSEKQPTITEQELLFMLDTIEEEGVLEEQEKDLVQSALEFDETTVQEILTPRVNMVALDISDPAEEILSVVTGERFSRMPVYEGNIDNVIGLVQSRDILEEAIRGKELCLRHLMTDVMYIHRTMKISKLLGEFQRKKSHLAVVIDDYGGTLGIVTMEDVLEELVGEIWDEDDEIVTEFSTLEDGSYRVSGDMNIYEFFEAIDYEPKGFDSSYNTMNGWALERLEHIPEAGEAFNCGLLTVTVEEMDDQRVTQLLVRKNEVKEQDAD
ncbi:MAG: hemolysin family protein [Angelakisella sp.]